MCDLSFGSGSIFTACKDSIVTKASYVRDLKDNLFVLERKSPVLIKVKEDVKTRIDVAEQQQMRWRLHQLQLWLTRVELVETQVAELLKLISPEIENLFLGGFCSKNLNRRYKYGKKVAKLLKVMTDLIGEGETFTVVAERMPQDLVYKRPSIPIDGLESKLEEVWSYIREAQVKIIGLYGKGGVGKTTLLTQINNKFFESSNNFLVIWVTVSKDLRLWKIQETILIRIDLWDEEEYYGKSLEERAMDICRILSRKKFVLLLDDIWEWVDLISIGIPPPSQKTDFKVVFTTRSLEVCTLMNTHINVEVQCLKHKEAWRLFQKNVGEETLNGHPDIPALAEKVAEECGGLPDVLNTVGQAMATKRTPEEWEHALAILRNSAHEFPGMGDKVYPLLKFSYDRLPETQRSCFLYCSLFPKGFHIAKRDLVDCWISEGFLKKYDGILARNFGYNIIRFLLHACLLEEGENNNFVKMHDIIRDMALWIAYEIEKGEKFSVHTDVGLIEAPRVPSNVQRMSLMENKIAMLFMIPNCGELLTLFLQSNPLRILTSGVFQLMPHLQVLNLSKTYLAKLPKGILKLVALRHLDLSWTKITELPEELKALTSLKCLNLEETNVLRKIPRHMISNLSMLRVLRVLRMFKCGLLSVESEDSILFGEGELFIEELVRLKHLNVFSIHFKNSRALQRFLNSHELQNCPTESVSLRLFDGLRSLNVLSLGKLKDLHTLFISSEYLVELVIDRQMRNVPQFHSLHKVQLFSCSKLRNATWLIFAPELEIVEISKCDDLKEIISFEDEVPEMTRNLLPFARLEHLILQFLEKLETIYCNPLPFPHLKQIFIKGCPKHKKLPVDSNSMTNKALKIRGEQHWWNDLQWEDEATENNFRPYFKAFDD